MYELDQLWLVLSCDEECGQSLWKSVVVCWSGIQSSVYVCVCERMSTRACLCVVIFMGSGGGGPPRDGLP